MQSGGPHYETAADGAIRGLSFDQLSRFERIAAKLEIAPQPASRADLLQTPESANFYYSSYTYMFPDA